MRRGLLLLFSLFAILSLGLQPASAKSKPKEYQLHPPIVGWYTDYSIAAPIRFQHYVQHGMRLVVANYDSAAHADQILQRAQAAGLKVLLMPSTGWIHTTDWQSLRSFVLQFKDNPALYGWYLAEEPEFIGDITPADLAHAYEVIKSVDPVHPVAVVFALGHCQFGSPQLSAGYLKGFDILMFDDYPFYRFMRSHQASAAGVREFQTDVRSCVAAAHRFHKRGPFMVMQGFGSGVADGPFHYRDPSLVEERAMFRTAVRGGARGILFWTYQFADHAVRVNVAHIVRSWYHGLLRRGVWVQRPLEHNANKPDTHPLRSCVASSSSRLALDRCAS